MKKLFWIVALLGAYIWLIASGNEEKIAQQCKKVYETITHWFKGADIDFQTEKKGSSIQTVRRIHRWD